MTGTQFPGKFGGADDIGVDLAAEAILLCAKMLDNDSQAQRPARDQHQVDVTAGVLLASGEGAEEEGDLDVRRQWRQRGFQAVRHAGGADHEVAQGLEDGR